MVERRHMVVVDEVAEMLMGPLKVEDFEGQPREHLECLARDGRRAGIHIGLADMRGEQG